MRTINVRLARCVVMASTMLMATSCVSANGLRAPSPNEQLWIERAIQVQVGPSEQGREALLEASIPVLVYLPDLICVAFKLRRSALGGETTVCFSRADDSVVINHAEGQ